MRGTPVALKEVTTSVASSVSVDPALSQEHLPLEERATLEEVSLPFQYPTSALLMGLLQVLNKEGASAHSVVNNVFPGQYFGYT